MASINTGVKFQVRKTKFGEPDMARILIVEDEPNMVAGLRDNFEFEGYQVITAPDGVAGLERALSEAPDLVILDVMMPRMSGLDVCRQLKSKRPSIPIIMPQHDQRNAPQDGYCGSPPHDTGRSLLRHKDLLKRDERSILRTESTLGNIGTPPSGGAVGCRGRE